MRRSQWFIFGICFFLLAGLFVSIDSLWGAMCDINDDSPVVQADIVKCVNAEIMDPFIWLLYPLALVFFICGLIEPKAENK